MWSTWKFIVADKSNIWNNRNHYLYIYLETDFKKKENVLINFIKPFISLNIIHAESHSYSSVSCRQKVNIKFACKIFVVSTYMTVSSSTLVSVTPSCMRNISTVSFRSDVHVSILSHFLSNSIFNTLVYMIHCLYVQIWIMKSYRYLK